ncbi:hypothetical protein BVRB_2g037650 [Beta vulgaris subsp. vulgaris]|nr:hypothetical protein BVRB_2g037650 [Beta vulgaris subsp. vulgaris]
MDFMLFKYCKLFRDHNLKSGSRFIIIGFKLGIIGNPCRQGNFPKELSRRAVLWHRVSQFECPTMSLNQG